MRHGEAMHYANQEMYIKVHHNRSIYRTFGLSLMQYSDNRIMLYSVNAIIPLHKHGERLLVSTAFVTNPGGCLKERLYLSFACSCIPIATRIRLWQSFYSIHYQVYFQAFHENTEEPCSLRKECIS